MQEQLEKLESMKYQHGREREAIAKLCADIADDIAHEAVKAALAVIDAHLKDTAKHEGSCGDELAYGLHKHIEKAIAAHLEKR